MSIICEVLNWLSEEEKEKETDANDVDQTNVSCDKCGGSGYKYYVGDYGVRCSCNTDG
jgi:hypothetical protein